MVRGWWGPRMWEKSRRGADGVGVREPAWDWGAWNRGKLWSAQPWGLQDTPRLVRGDPNRSTSPALWEVMRPRVRVWCPATVIGAWVEDRDVRSPM